MLFDNFYSEKELKKIGLGSFGRNVLISKKCSIYGASRIYIGSNVRIDDFCVLSAGKGGIYLGSYIHIAAHCLLIGDAKIDLKDFCGLSSRVTIYSSSDDYTGNYLTNPTVPRELTNVRSEEVMLGKHVIIGTNSTILPGVIIEDGVAIYAMSLINKNCDGFYCYFGIPAKRVKKRSKNLLEYEAILESKIVKFN